MKCRRLSSISFAYGLASVVTSAIPLAACDDSTFEPAAPSVQAIDASVEWDATDVVLFNRFAAIVAASQGTWEEVENERSFSPTDMEIYFVRRDATGPTKAYLVNPHVVPVGAVPVTHALLGIGDVYRYDAAMTALNGLEFSQDFRIAGLGSVYAQAYRTPGQGVPVTLDPGHEEWSRYFIHEGFHHWSLYADEAIWPKGSGPWQYPMTANNIGLAMLEHSTLLAGSAVIEEGAPGPTPEQTLRQMLAIRRTRLALPEATQGLCGNGGGGTFPHATGASAPWGLGQSFVACKSGQIRKLYLYVFQNTATSVVLKLQQGETAWNAPIASTQTITLVPGRNVIPLTVPLTVQAGSTYAFALFPSDGFLAVRSSGAASASDGERFFVSNGNRVGSTPSTDLQFMAWVEGNAIAAYDSNQERKEGSATSVELATEEALGMSAFVDEWKFTLRETTNWVHTSTSMNQLFGLTIQGGGYGNGEQMIGLLDALGANDFRSGFAEMNGAIETVDALYGPTMTAMEQATLVEQAKQAYGWYGANGIAARVAALNPAYVGVLTFWAPAWVIAP